MIAASVVSIPKGRQNPKAAINLQINSSLVEINWRHLCFWRHTNFFLESGDRGLKAIPTQFFFRDKGLSDASQGHIDRNFLYCCCDAQTRNVRTFTSHSFSCNILLIFYFFNLQTAPATKGRREPPGHLCTAPQASTKLNLKWG